MVVFGGAILSVGLAGVAGASAPSSSPIKVHLALNKDRVVAGEQIKGTALLMNTTSRTITVQACAENGWLQVGLRDHDYSYQSSSLLVNCPPSIRLAPGPNRFPIVVLTRYQSCLEPGGQSLVPTHNCLRNGGLPPLPAGKYSTTVYVFGLTGLTEAPKSVTVTLLPANP
jgi:hypothetical protein